MSIFAKINRLFRREPLSCRQVNQFIVDYLEGDMDERTRIQFESHLHNCPNCTKFLDQYRETVYLVHDSDDVELPPELVDRTVDFLRNHYEDDRD